MNETIFHKLRLNEWQAIQTQAKKIWMRDVLGVRPTFNEVRSTMPNVHSISALEYLAMLVLIVLTLFTSYKVGALAVPFAQHTLETLTQHTALDQWVQVTFTIVTAFLFMLLATPSVIYFKLLSHEPEITIEKRDTKALHWYSIFSLDYLTPRLPGMIVYFSIFWLVYISSQLPGTVFEQYLPVVVEVGLAALVGHILKKRKDFNDIVNDALAEKTKPYDLMWANYETEGAYLRILYQVMQEAVVKIKRLDPAARREVQVNAWLEAADESVVYRVLSAEYHRLNQGNSFAQDVISGEVATQAEPVADEIRTKRLPPAGLRAWTPETLCHDLRVRGIDPAAGYNEDQLAKDYETAYKPRSAWRGGAKALFLGS